MANFLDTAGLTYLWGKIKTALSGKVDKVSGKGLSTNDYTTAEKNKLTGIETGANKYVHPSYTAKTNGLTRMKKEMVCTITGAIGGTIAYFFGGWDQALVTLIIFMAIDYISGLIVAGVFHNSKKTESGTLESRTGWKGLCRKCMTLLFVLVAYRLDLAIGVDYIRDAVIIGFIANELISIVENAGLMGIPLPAVIANAIDILTQKAEKKGDA
jgi:toxin secretion/phage lysis holin